MTAHRRYFVFLRAVNTGRRRLTNEQLLAPFLDLGFGGVSAYQAAGNITFTARNPAQLLRERIEPLLADAYGFETPTFVRSSAELCAIVDGQPFSDDELTGTDGKIQVTFMRTPPEERVVTQAGELVPADDRVVIRGREWFWLPRRGISDSSLPVAEIEALVGPMTMRTLGTLRRLRDRFTE